MFNRNNVALSATRSNGFLDLIFGGGGDEGPSLTTGSKGNNNSGGHNQDNGDGRWSDGTQS